MVVEVRASRVRIPYFITMLIFLSWNRFDEYFWLYHRKTCCANIDPLGLRASGFDDHNPSTTKVIITILAQMGDTRMLCVSLRRG